MTDWKKIGVVGRAIANAIPESAKDRIRADYVKRFGKCRRCEAPLSGPSPDQICTTCHADEALGRVGGANGGDPS